ncbi:MAG: hypothetical protein HY275_14850, partial [Gemmatimonadetes bacterium]|nr:hypothetical protein [Gemmatimonadota bacterium]
QVQDSLGTPRNAGPVPITFALATSPNPKASLAGTVTVTAQPASARSPATPTEAKVSGLKVTEDGVGFRLSASAPKLSSATSTPFTLARHGPPRSLAFEGPVPVSNAGGTIAPAVSVLVRDSVGNVVETSLDQVSLALESNAAGATLGGTLVSAAQAGRASFAGLSVSATGTGYVLQATSASLEGTKSEPFSVVDAGAPCKLAFTQPPVRATAGAAFTPAIAVAVQKCDGGLIPGATDEITVSLGGAAEGATLSGTVTANAAAGSASFADLSVKRAGDGYTLIARAKGLTPATSAGFSVSPGAPAKLVVVDQPDNGVAGQPMRGQVRVIVADANGNRVPTATNPVAIAVNCAFKSTSTTKGPVVVGFAGMFAEPSGTCSSPKGPSTPALRGEATFDLTRYRVRGAASEARFVFSSPGLTDGESGPFTIAPGAPFTLGFENVLTAEGRRAKVQFDDIRVAVRDSLGNDVGQGNDLISLALGPGGGGTLGGAREQRAENGAATFNNLSVSEGGAVTLVASAPGLANGTSLPFGVASYGKPTRLFFKVVPSTAAPDQKFTVRVEVQDDVGNVVDSAHVSITLTIDNNPGNGELRGQGPNDTKQGVAEFRDVRINRPGEGYSLRATAPGYPEAVSAPFTIGTPPPPAAAGKPQGS